ncbi:egg cell-secreted protein 1.4-like [Macadamia integrifolia]|uniref:egg cell-secreted protein 1.4-like n=1 Tax=Macadamia integrifolia TaxID=60698 RepID=UPI001C4F8339|nr:egg cell-secreted protein 1.4-like [Macadamia integrifolia]
MSGLLLILACTSMSTYAATSTTTSDLSKVTLKVPIAGLDTPFKGNPFIGILPPGLNPKVQHCWLSLHSTTGCVQQIFNFLWLAPPNPLTLESDCCKAITEVNNNCWLVMFPFYPQLPNILNGHCVKVGGIAPNVGPTDAAAPSS